MSHPGQYDNQILPALYLPPHPAVLRLLGLHEAPEVVASYHDLESISLEECLHQHGIPGRHDQDDLGKLQELTSQKPSQHQFIQVMPNTIKGTTRPNVIPEPVLGEAGERLPQLTNEQEYYNPMRHHHQ